MNMSIFNTEFIHDFENKYDNIEEGIAPQTVGMTWCMFATGIHRIFSKEILHEFLFRLAITMDSIKLVENWFAWDKFLTFTIGDMPFSLTEQDVFNHYGMQILDSTNDMIPRSDYYKRIYELLGSTQFIGFLSGNFQVIKPEKTYNEDGDAEFTFDISKKPPIITPELENKARIFADNVLKNADPNQLILAPAAQDKRAQIARRIEAIKQLPKFSLSIIPKEIQHKCLFKFFDDDYANHLIHEASEEEYNKETYRFFNLAWLVANNLLWFEQEYDFNQLEGIEFNPLDYEEESSSSVPIFYMSYNLDECESLLKGIGFDK